MKLYQRLQLITAIKFNENLPKTTTNY